MRTEKSRSRVLSTFWRCSSDSTEYASSAVTSGDRTSYSDGTTDPSMRNIGGTPAVMWRSDALRWIMSSSSCLSVITWSHSLGKASDVVRRGFLQDFLGRGHSPPQLAQPIHAQRAHALRQREALH